MEHKKDNGLKVNLVYNICYQILSLIVPLITAPYISRVLGKDGVGAYSYTYSVAHYFVLFIMLGVLNYGNREIARVKNNKEALIDTFCGIYTVQLCLGIIITFFYAIYVIAYKPAFKTICMAQGLYVISGMLDISWFYFGIEKFKTTTKVSMINKLLTTLLIFALVRDSDDIFLYTSILSGGALFNNIIYWLLLKQYINVFTINIHNSIQQIKPLLILFIPVIAVNAYKYMDKIMLGLMINTAEVGIYEAAEKFINLPLSLITAVGTVMLPRISTLIKESNDIMVRKYNNISMILIMFMSFGIVFGLAGITKPFIPWFYGSEFLKSADVLIVLLPSVIFVSWANVVRTQCLLPSMRDKEYCISVICGAIVNFLINYLLIPKLGSKGAAVGTTIAELTVCFIQTVETRKDMEFWKYAINSLPFFLGAIIMYLIIARISTSSDFSTIIIRILVGGIIYIGVSSAYIIKISKNYQADA